MERRSATQCSNWFRAHRIVAAAAALAVLSGCGPSQDAGYDKLAFRDKEPLEAPARPNPPPVRAGIGAPAGGEMPQLAEATAPAGVTQEMVEQGAELYGTVCAACHGPAGAGTTLAPSLQDTEWLTISGSYDEIVNVIHTGVASPAEFPGMMPPMGGGSFDDDQVRAIAAYVFALSNQPAS